MKSAKNTKISPSNTNIDKIEVEHKLANKVKVVANFEAVEKEYVTRAESAIQLLSVQFDEWLGSDLNKLIAARDNIQKNGLNQESIQNLYLASMELKGLGTTFGFPLVSKLSYSLCAMIDGIQNLQKIPVPVLEQHVDAIAALIKENARNHGSVIARTLVDKLCTVTEDYVKSVRTDA